VARKPVWLNRAAVVAMHDMMLAQFGGEAGIRDEGLLDSALARPRNISAYRRASVFALASAYAVGLTRNHPFVDGNKRAALMSAYGFLGLNGYDLEASEPEAVVMMTQLAMGDVSERELARWLQRNSKRQARSPRR
jgi:death-on-curing protein